MNIEAYPDNDLIEDIHQLAFLIDCQEAAFGEPSVETVTNLNALLDLAEKRNLDEVFDS